MWGFSCRKRSGLKSGRYDGNPNWLPEGVRYNCQSGGQGPAYQGEGEEQEKRGEAYGAEDAAFAEERDAGFAVGAKKNDDESDGGPGKAGRQAGVASDQRHKILRRLPGGEPPGKNGSDTGNYDEAEKFSRKPAFYFLTGFATNKIVPYE